MIIVQVYIIFGLLDISENYFSKNIDDLEVLCFRNIKKEECLSVGDSVQSITNRGFRERERWILQFSFVDVYLLIRYDKFIFFIFERKEGMVDEYVYRCVWKCVCVYRCVYVYMGIVRGYRGELGEN